MKKILSFILALMMVLSVASFSVSAETVTVTVDGLTNSWSCADENVTVAQAGTKTEEAKISAKIRNNKEEVEETVVYDFAVAESGYYKLIEYIGGALQNTISVCHISVDDSSETEIAKAIRTSEQYGEWSSASVYAPNTEYYLKAGNHKLILRMEETAAAGTTGVQYFFKHAKFEKQDKAAVDTYIFYGSDAWESVGENPISNTDTFKMKIDGTAQETYSEHGRVFKYDKNNYDKEKTSIVMTKFTVQDAGYYSISEIEANSDETEPIKYTSKTAFKIDDGQYTDITDANMGEGVTSQIRSDYMEKYSPNMKYWLDAGEHKLYLKFYPATTQSQSYRIYSYFDHFTLTKSTTGAEITSEYIGQGETEAIAASTGTVSDISSANADVISVSDTNAVGVGYGEAEVMATVDVDSTAHKVVKVLKVTGEDIYVYGKNVTYKTATTNVPALATATAKLENAGSTDKALKVIIAAYDGTTKVLKTASVQDVTVGAGKFAFARADLLGVDDTDSIRAFVWGEDYAPLTYDFSK